MISYTVKSNRNQQMRSMLGFIGGSEEVKYDFSPWEDDNGSVTSVTWTVKSGQASVANEALTSSVASADISTSESGASMIKLTATAGNNIFITYLRIVSKDPTTKNYDYGLCQWGL